MDLSKIGIVPKRLYYCEMLEFEYQNRPYKGYIILVDLSLVILCKCVKFNVHMYIHGRERQTAKLPNIGYYCYSFLYPSA